MDKMQKDVNVDTPTKSAYDYNNDDYSTNLGCACIGPTILAIVLGIIFIILAIKTFV
ncbi:hypothetical protein J6Z48_01735 [bacterium]|nr:hypothetical protein [bacterium]